MKSYLITFCILFQCFISNAQVTDFKFINCDSILISGELEVDLSDLNKVTDFFWIKENVNEKWDQSKEVKIRIASEEDFDNISEIWSFSPENIYSDLRELWICKSIKYEENGEYGQDLSSCEFIEYQINKSNFKFKSKKKKVLFEITNDSKFCLTLKRIN